jgi:hypothetical protein
MADRNQRFVLLPAWMWLHGYGFNIPVAHAGVLHDSSMPLGQGGHCLNVLKTFTEASLSVKAGSAKKTVQLIMTAQPSRPLVREHDASDLGRLVDLRPVPRVKRVKGGVPGLGFEVLGDADMKIGVGVPPDEQEGQVGAP